MEQPQCALDEKSPLCRAEPGQAMCKHVPEGLSHPSSPRAAGSASTLQLDRLHQMLLLETRLAYLFCVLHAVVSIAMKSAYLSARQLSCKCCTPVERTNSKVLESPQSSGFCPHYLNNQIWRPGSPGRRMQLHSQPLKSPEGRMNSPMHCQTLHAVGSPSWPGTQPADRLCGPNTGLRLVQNWLSIHKA